jgi:hypothetical protein
MKRETQRVATHILRNKSTGWLRARIAAKRRSTDRKHPRKQIDSWTKAGRKKSAQLFHFFLCLRMVSALRPAAMSCLAYHTPDILRHCFFKSRYAFRQSSYIAWVRRPARAAFLPLAISSVLGNGFSTLDINAPVGKMTQLLRFMQLT